MKALLQAREIHKYFEGPTRFHALKGIDLDINQGEFVALVGKSGCGKSTLLYVLSTMDTDYQGELYLNGEKLTNKTLNELAAIRNKHIGFVFQFHFLLPEFTVLQNIMIPALRLGIYSRQEIEHRAIERLKWLDIDQQALKLSSKLSGGQQQRVAIARALINDPLIIMGDEPTGNLDSLNTDLVFGLLREISSDKGQTIIAVTHDNQFAQRCDRVIEMSDGGLV